VKNSILNTRNSELPCTAQLATRTPNPVTHHQTPRNPHHYRLDTPHYKLFHNYFVGEDVGVAAYAEVPFGDFAVVLCKNFD